MFRIAFGLAFFLAGLFWAVFGLRRAMRTRRSLSARGEIVSVDGFDPPTVHADFQDATGTRHRGSTTYNRKNIPFLYVGQQVHLRYDPKHPTWMILEDDEFSYFACAVVSTMGLTVGPLLIRQGILLW